MTELLHNERNAYLFSNGNDVDFQVISWTDEELEEEKTPEKQLSVDKDDEKLKVGNPKKKKKTKKKKKKASDEQKDVDNHNNNNNNNDNSNNNKNNDNNNNNNRHIPNGLQYGRSN